MTLTFVSIEAARAALLEIPSSSLVGGPAPERPYDAVGYVLPSGEILTDDGEIKQPKQPKAEAPKAVKAKPAAVVATPAPVVEAPASTASSSEPAASVDYPTLQKAVFALAGKSRESAAAVAASMGVKTFKELPEAKWAEALAAVNVALAA